MKRVLMLLFFAFLGICCGEYAITEQECKDSGKCWYSVDGCQNKCCRTTGCTCAVANDPCATAIVENKDICASCPQEEPVSRYQPTVSIR